MTGPASAPRYVRSPSVEFLSSLAVDRPLARQDLAGSIVHVEMLERVGLVTASESATLRRTLRAIAREVDEGSFPWRSELEDVHTNIESRLLELVGLVGGKLHTARSRNDQIALDERLYLRSAIASVVRPLVDLEEALAREAERHAALPMPGYTHLQRGQPVTVGHWLLAHLFRFDRDIDRLLSTARRANVSPLGAGALATSTLPVDPRYTADRLGFDRPFENSIDAVSDRDYFAELLFDLSLAAVHASSLAEELVIFATKEFGFVERSAALGAGSSLMPQKRNPDVPELVRGRTGRVVGDLVALLTTLKGLPLAYDRDLQEDKAPVLDAVATVSASIGALATVVSGLSFRVEPLRAAASDPELLATDRAEAQVAEGMPFRAAHEAVAESYASAPGPVAPTPDVGSAIERRSVPGGPSAESVAAQLAEAAARRARHHQSLSSLDRQIGLIEGLLKEVPQ